LEDSIKFLRLVKNFRNEGIDLTHNPEFTGCEFYMAYADYHDLMRITEELIVSIVMKLFGNLVVKYTKSDGTEIEIDFTPPEGGYKKYPLIATLEEKIGKPIPRPLSSEETRAFLVAECESRGLYVEPPTISRLLDKLVGELIEPDIINPGFICDHPQIMSPLAKYHRDYPELTERFELFIATKEVCNAYTELNNPFVQRETFISQVQDKLLGEEESQPYDEDYCKALEYGLPPTGGWGMGIDRMTMFLSNCSSIKEVILFPAMKPREDIQPHNENNENNQQEPAGQPEPPKNN